MKIKHVLLVALTALALSLASIGATGPAIAGGSGGVFNRAAPPAARLQATGPAIAGGNGGVFNRNTL